MCVWASNARPSTCVFSVQVGRVNGSLVQSSVRVSESGGALAAASQWSAPSSAVLRRAAPKRTGARARRRLRRRERGASAVVYTVHCCSSGQGKCSCKWAQCRRVPRSCDWHSSAAPASAICATRLRAHTRTRVWASHFASWPLLLSVSFSVSHTHTHTLSLSLSLCQFLVQSFTNGSAAREMGKAESAAGIAICPSPWSSVAYQLLADGSCDDWLLMPSVQCRCHCHLTFSPRALATLALGSMTPSASASASRMSCSVLSALCWLHSNSEATRQSHAVSSPAASRASAV